MVNIITIPKNFGFEFKMEAKRDYHDLYLKVDVFIDRCI